MFVPRRGGSRFRQRLLLLESYITRIVACFEELGGLVDAEQCIDVEDERDNNLIGGERPAPEGCVPCVGEGITVRGTPDVVTVVPGLDCGFVG